MQSANKKQLLVPCLVILVGVGWLLNALDLFPAVDWVWTLSLAGAGALSLLLGGLNRLTIVVGPFLLVSAMCSIFRQTGQLALKFEMPILVIALGVLLLVSQLSNLPAPQWFQDESDTKKDE